MAERREITGYRIWMMDRQWNWGPGTNGHVEATIICFTNEGDVVLVFQNADFDSVSATQQNDPIRIFLPNTRYPMYLDLLRNEGPLEIYIDDDDRIFIQTKEIELVGPNDD